MDHTESEIGTEVKAVLVAVLDSQGIHSRELPDVALRVGHLK
jgi:hypothetical protein